MYEGKTEYGKKMKELTEDLREMSRLSYELLQLSDGLESARQAANELAKFMNENFPAQSSQSEQ